MAPEYAMEGLFSVKSDVFSFGVMILEILSGRKNSGFYQTGQAPTLLAYVSVVKILFLIKFQNMKKTFIIQAWQLWTEGRGPEFVYPFQPESCPIPEILKMLQIGLLCVQEDPASRPTMSSVVALLQNDPTVALPEPRKPAFSMTRIVSSVISSTINQSMSNFPTCTMSPR